MNPQESPFLVFALVALAGLGRQQAVADDASGHAGYAETPPRTGCAAAQGAVLGTAVATGPLCVTLTTEPARPRTGDTLFAVRLERGGEPETGAPIRPGDRPMETARFRGEAVER